jgi:hypothetical protein
VPLQCSFSLKKQKLETTVPYDRSKPGKSPQIYSSGQPIYILAITINTLSAATSEVEPFDIEETDDDNENSEHHGAFSGVQVILVQGR